MRFFLEIAYSGTPFHGWQRQPNAVTVQQCVEESLATVLRHPTQVTGCGRTDTGVHASQYFLHFDADQLPDRFLFGLNGVLPTEISAIRIAEVDAEAHARFDATSRSYEYHIHQRKDPFLDGLSAAIYADLDVKAMQQASLLLLDHDDFASFCKVGSDVKTTLCNVTHVAWSPMGHRLVFSISANRFLRNMVRAIVGTLLDVGMGKTSVEQFAEILDAGDRTVAGKSAAACGLYLTKVEYPFL